MTEITVADAQPTESIAQRAAAGDEAAFARLIEAHDSSMGRVAYVIAGDWAVADEAVQAAWAIAWTKLKTLRTRAVLAPHICSPSRNRPGPHDEFGGLPTSRDDVLCTARARAPSSGPVTAVSRAYHGP